MASSPCLIFRHFQCDPFPHTTLGLCSATVNVLNGSRAEAGSPKAMKPRRNDQRLAMTAVSAVCSAAKARLGAQYELVISKLSCRHGCCFRNGRCVCLAVRAGSNALRGCLPGWSPSPHFQSLSIRQSYHSNRAGLYLLANEKASFPHLRKKASVSLRRRGVSLSCLAES